MVNHRLQYGHTPYSRWSITVSSTATHHTQDGPPTLVGCSPTIPTMVTHYFQGEQPPSPGQSSSTIARPFTNNPHDSHHHPQDGHLVSPRWSTNVHYPCDCPTVGWARHNFPHDGMMVTLHIMVNQTRVWLSRSPAYHYWHEHVACQLVSVRAADWPFWDLLAAILDFWGSHRRNDRIKKLI